MDGGDGDDGDDMAPGGGGPPRKKGKRAQQSGRAAASTLLRAPFAYVSGSERLALLPEPSYIPASAAGLASAVAMAVAVPRQRLAAVAASFLPPKGA